MTGSQRQTAAQEAASLLNEQTEATRALIGTAVALAVLLPSVEDTMVCPKPRHEHQPISKAYEMQKVEAIGILMPSFGLTTICP